MQRTSASVQEMSTNQLSSAYARLMRLGGQAFMDAMQIGQPFMEAYLRSIEDILPRMQSLTGVRHCEIPETACPPYCVCELNWEVLQGEQVQGTVRVTNTGKQARNFNFTTEPFIGRSGDSGVEPNVEPVQVNIAAGDSALVTVSFAAEKNLEPDSSYVSTVKITGLYEQCVRLNVNVLRRSKPHCEVKQGEIPTRVVSHHWYDHFQCEETCFEPVLHRDEVGITGVVVKPKG